MSSVTNAACRARTRTWRRVTSAPAARCGNESSRSERWQMSSTSTAPGRSRSSRSTSRAPSPRCLSGNDWSRWRPRVVVVEATDPWSFQQTHLALGAAALGGGYLFASFDGINRFYARAEEPDLVAHLAPASVLDNFVSENLNRVEGYVRHLEAELKARSAHVAELETFVGRQEEIIHARDRRIAELEARAWPAAASRRRQTDEVTDRARGRGPRSGALEQADVHGLTDRADPGRDLRHRRWCSP